MKIIDTHFHLWDLDQNHYPWLSDRNWPTLVKNADALRKNYVIEDYLRDVGTLDVIAAVHVQAEHDHSDPVRETRWLQGVADAPGSRGLPQAIVAEANFASPDVERILEAHAAYRNLRGIRYALHRRLDESPAYDPLLDSRWTRNFGLLRKLPLSFDMQLFPEQHPAAVELARVHPEVAIVLTHAAMPVDRSEPGIDLWRTAIRAYAACPNICIKISGFGGEDPHWNARSIDPIVTQVMDAFGPARCMLGSNFPVESLVKPYADIWRVFEEYFSSYTDYEREQIFWRNAARTYRIAL